MNKLAKLLNFSKTHVPFHRRRAPENHLELENWPLMTMEHVAAHSIDTDDDLLADSDLVPGYVVASGGTMGNPKYLHYSSEEAVIQSGNIARNFTANGLAAGDRIVNYFSAGDMWSSFLLVDKAMATLPVTIFPLGCSPRPDFALQILRRFKPNVIAGIPSMLVNLARAGATGDPIRLQKVYYAGEHMSVAMKNILRSLWGSELIRSAGYASTDLGTIGWQCLHCEPDEHFSYDDVIVEIIDEEIVVTSLSRFTMPFIRYRTGDRGEWSEASCACGNGARTFKLMGRLDSNLIIWGCWIAYQDVAAAFADMQIDHTSLQLAATAQGEEQLLTIRFESATPLNASLHTQLRKQIYERCGDLNAEVPLSFVETHLCLKEVEAGALTRNPRTGKVSPIVDMRS